MCHLICFLLHHALTTLLSFLLSYSLARKDRTPVGLLIAESATPERHDPTVADRTFGGIALSTATVICMAITIAATVILAATVASVVFTNVVVSITIIFTATSAFLESDRRWPRTTTPLGRETDLGAVLTLRVCAAPLYNESTALGPVRPHMSRDVYVVISGYDVRSSAERRRTIVP